MVLNMQTTKILSVGFIAISLFGCANANKLNAINIGMTKYEVMKNLGNPNSTSATNGVQYLNYDFYPTDDHAWSGISRQYFVRLVNGKVDAFGQIGDFDSTKVPEIKSTINLNIKNK